VQALTPFLKAAGLQYPIFPRVIILGTAIYTVRSVSEQSQTLHYLSEETLKKILNEDKEI